MKFSLCIVQSVWVCMPICLPTIMCVHMTGLAVRWSLHVTVQEEMSHALATMRFKDEPATIKPMGESKNSLLSRRKNKKKH